MRQASPQPSEPRKQCHDRHGGDDQPSQEQQPCAQFPSAQLLGYLKVTSEDAPCTLPIDLHATHGGIHGALCRGSLAGRTPGGVIRETAQQSDTPPTRPMFQFEFCRAGTHRIAAQGRQPALN